MTGVDDLVSWLRAQLGEDERVARSATGGDDGWLFRNPESPVEEHIARWDPARVLAEVDAKRRMLDWCDRMVIVDGHGGLMARDARLFGRLLALPYADREGYREEWRP